MAYKEQHKKTYRKIGFKQEVCEIFNPYKVDFYSLIHKSIL